jgi:predicted GNAT family N-acyltransferase
MQVFVQEQGVPEELELDEFDSSADHALAYIQNQCVGTARLILRSDGRAQIGRMAVLREFRQKGVGRQLLRALILLGKSRGIVEFELHAQVSAISFYEKLGFIPHGEVYDEAGIPHRNMILLLKIND